ncbi:MAG: hypothetical protein Q9160_000296 [Pyrenula sp. 1 TL-2023]
MDDITANFDDYQKRVTGALVATTRIAGQVAARDLSFHRASSSAVSEGLDTQSMRMLQLTNKLLKAVNRPSATKPIPKLRTQEGVEDNWRGIVDVIDDLLEKADRNLDEFTGVIKQVGSSSKPVTDTPPRADRRGRPSILSTQSVPKPQLNFDTKVNNFEDGPWKPLLKKKPHAKVPLEQSVVLGEDGQYSHPYGHEIKESTYPPFVHDRSIPIRFQDPSTTPIIFVDTEQGVSDMLSELKEAREIAIDLEHHDTHSYVGLTSLMQISTREKDWVIDTLRPWRQNLQVLNEVFADSRILKVLHGSNMDIIWLQRDLGLYIVGLFDTYHAANALHLPTKSLKYLLSTYAGFSADKKHQLADWRLRPLPAEQLEYARSDTHYLLYIYDQLRNELLEGSRKGNDLMDYVLRHSKSEALQRYSRLVYQGQTGLGSNGWFSLVVRKPGKLNTQQFTVLRAVHEWRDRTARAEDESPYFIMPLRTLDSIALLMPTTVPELMTAANPVSKSVSKGASELVEIIKKAKEEGKDGVSISQVIQENDKLIAARDNVPRSDDSAQTPALPSNFFTQSVDNEQMQRALAENAPRSQLLGQALPLPSFSMARVSQQISAGLNNLLWPAPNPIDVDKHHSEGQKATSTEPVHDSAASRPREFASGQTKDDVFTIRKNKQLSNNGRASTQLPRNGRSTGPDLQEFRGHNSSDSDSASDEEDGEAVEEDQNLLHSKVQSQSNEDGDDVSDVKLEVTQKDLSHLSKKQRQRRRKAERKRSLNVAQQKGPKAQKQESMTPFDYTKAEPVLEPKNGNGGDASKVGGKRQRPPFDPYAKALDAPGGLKKAKKSNQGKSATFH